MTDAEGTTQDASAARPRPLPGTSSPNMTRPSARPRPLWPRAGDGDGRGFLLAAVVVLGLAAGLVVWAPWTPPPVLRPSGLVVGPSTANSISFRVVAPARRPASGQVPDPRQRHGGHLSYRDSHVLPAGEPYPGLHLPVPRGGGDGKRSPGSAVLTMRTLTPPISQARLQGSWQVYAENIGHARGGRNGYMRWQLSPPCAVGACDVVLHVKDGSFSFKMKLARAGAVYEGQARASLGRCGPRGQLDPGPRNREDQDTPY